MAILKSISRSQLTDAELVQVYQTRQQQQVLAELYLRYSDVVYGVCVKYLKDQESAKDAVINIYQELVEKLKNPQVVVFRSWLYVVAKNHCLMQLRKNKQAKIVELEPSFMQSEDFWHLEDVLNKEEKLNQLEICMKQLQLDQMETVSLFYLQNKCYAQISTITGHDWNKVRSLIQNGKRNLKICIEKNVV